MFNLSSPYGRAGMKVVFPTTCAKEERMQLGKFRVKEEVI